MLNLAERARAFDLPFEHAKRKLESFSFLLLGLPSRRLSRAREYFSTLPLSAFSLSSSSSFSLYSVSLPLIFSLSHFGRINSRKLRSSAPPPLTLELLPFIMHSPRMRSIYVCIFFFPVFCWEIYTGFNLWTSCLPTFLHFIVLGSASRFSAFYFEESF